MLIQIKTLDDTADAKCKKSDQHTHNTFHHRFRLQFITKTAKEQMVIA